MPRSKLFSPSISAADKAILLLHGGVFTDGDESWNGAQAQSIAERCHADVYTMDFRKDSYPATINDIKSFFIETSRKYESPVGLVGCSSGGFLALNLLKEPDLPLPSFVVLICPVIHPEKRENLLFELETDHAPMIHKKQLTFFKEYPYPEPYYQSRTPLHLIAATNDINVPLPLIESEAKKFRNAQLHIFDGTHNLSHKPSKEINDLLFKLSSAQTEEASFQLS